MSPRRVRPRALLACGAALLLAPLTLAGVPTASAAPTRGTEPYQVTPLTGTIRDSKLKGALDRSSVERQSVFVQLAGPGAASVADRTLKSASRAPRTAARTATRDRRADVARDADQVLAAARRSDPQVRKLFAVSNAVPGLGMVADLDTLKALAERDDVVAITPIVPKKVSNASTSQLTRAVNTWKSPGVTGKGVKIGIIDTGIDYTHADFGGAGTVSAYDKALKSQGTFAGTAKVVGGADFVGDDYNADPAAEAYQPVPSPDRNPLDCNEHGTHVAGTAAGYGVNADGSTYRGSYTTLDRSKLYGMRIGPGMAPQASLYALKVFGCEGSTDAVIPALDWALDPNGDGDFADHLDIVNLSLGSDFSAADDPENAVVDVLAKNGVLPVMAAGNAGDLTDAAGSPGNAVRSLAVASSVDELQLRDGLRVTAPTDLAGVVASQFSVAYPWADKAPVSGQVVALSTANADGCAPLGTADAAKVDGKVAWLEWDDDDATRLCGSAARAANVAAAGAVGAIYTAGVDVFDAGITGSPTIPVVQLPKAGTDRLRPAVTAGTLAVTFDGSLRGTIKSITPAITDTLSSFSSRGGHGQPGVVKPDVTAPGDTITSAGMGTGNDQLTISGTSMASPATAGIAALVRAAHPSWNVERVKAAVMNTAGHDVYTEPSRKGLRYGPARVGAGRVDALAAVKTEVLAYTLGRGAVSASFGVVAVPADKAKVTRTQQVRIRNNAKKTTTATVAYQPVVTQPGVSYKASKSKVTIKAGRYVDVTVTMTVTTAKLRHTLDPTMAETQTDAFFVGPDDEPLERARQYVSDASGRLLVTPAGKTALRVPVYGAAKPASTTHADDTTPGGTPTLVVKGTGFAQGGGSTAFESKLSVLTLGYNSPRQPKCGGVQAAGCAATYATKAGDLHYVGAGAVAGDNGSKADGALWFGLSTWGNMSTIGHYNTPFVDIDTTGDGKADFETIVQAETDTDIYNALTFDLRKDPDEQLVDVQPLNFGDGDFETNVFDTNTLLIPVSAAAIGVTDAASTFPITYRVGTFNYYASPLTENIQDQTPAVAFDVVNPGVQVDGIVYPDVAGTKIPYRTAAAGPLPRALILHLHGVDGTRAEAQTLHATPAG
ncbi:PA domain-containing protein [Friedmanniella luteola]|uniref:PA domain-containing protein n=1 Tax=Friedmanniella luteola TaxID=546871 RepID=A0A1H1LZE9_9ACTN|nr:S8 family serine peptidase [Friedmanniella luteola]SDR79787.1 PA domain-containing protein [Friedmanniella luteola]